MDLNRLYFLHQLALMRAQASHSGSDCVRHTARADRFAGRISHFQRHAGALAAPLPAARCAGAAA
jgi:hypothetical protein